MFDYMSTDERVTMLTHRISQTSASDMLHALCLFEESDQTKNKIRAELEKGYERDKL